MSSSYPARRRRRQHAPEFKRGLVALCQPGVSISAVALAHGVNANLLRRWIRQYSGMPASQTASPTSLVAVRVDMPDGMNPDDAIEIAIQKNNARINIRWPGNRASACGQWLREWIK